MPFDPILAETRYGVGLSPHHAPVGSAQAMLDQVQGPDHIASEFVIPILADTRPSVRDILTAHGARVEARGTAREQEMLDAFRALRRTIRETREGHLLNVLARWTQTPDGFRERLTTFWADHFTAVSTIGQTSHMIQPYIEEAIRPHVTGKFSDMLQAVVTHPIMLRYLDQNVSMGPNSAAAARRSGQGRGLNENLAREVLELHTLGVDGPYTQQDVTELAELFTGLSYNPSKGFVFRSPFAEPGPETILGETYGGDPARVDHVYAVLDDLADHPATARHLAQKLVVHFLNEDPDTDLVDRLADVFQTSDGQLMEVYDALLSDERAWDPQPHKVKPPFDFIASSLRALAVPPERILSFTRQDILAGLHRPLQLMGQTWENPVGPDGWPEEAEEWITAQGMAARISWAMNIPRRALGDLPDPVEFVQTALGPDAPQVIRFAAQSAETRGEAIGLVLASSAFNRR